MASTKPVVKPEEVTKPSGETPAAEAPKTESPTVETPVPSEKAAETVSSFSQIADAPAESSEKPVDAPAVSAPATPPVPQAQPTETTNQTSQSEASEWVQQDKDSMTEEPKKKVGKKALVGGLVTFVVVGVLAGGIFYFNSKVSNPSPVQTDTNAQTTVPSATASPTAAPEVDLTTLKINILNGSGKAGQAGIAQGLLEKAGFEGIDTGNADSFDFTATQVALKADLHESVFTSVSDALSDTYVVEKADALDADSEFDIVITIGSSTP